MILLVRTTSELPLGFTVSPTGDVGFDKTGKLELVEVWIASCRKMRDMETTTRIWVKPADLVDDSGMPLEHAEVCTAVDAARARSLEEMRRGPLGANWP